MKPAVTEADIAAKIAAGPMTIVEMHRSFIRAQLDVSTGYIRTVCRRLVTMRLAKETRVKTVRARLGVSIFSRPDESLAAIHEAIARLRQEGSAFGTMKFGREQ